MTLIRNREFAQQIVDFGGLRYGSISPTDIDAFLDFGDKLFVFVEAKFGKTSMSKGQAWALARLVDACHKPPDRYAIALVCSHNDVGDVDLSKARVERLRWNEKWVAPKLDGATVRFAIDEMRKRFLGDQNA